MQKRIESLQEELEQSKNYYQENLTLLEARFRDFLPDGYIGITSK